MHGGMTDRVRRIEQTWHDAGFNVEAFADVTLMIWEKFLCNVTLSAPCAVFDVTVGELMSDPEAWKVALGCTSEAYRLGLAKGIEFSFDDPLRYVTDFAATIPNASPSMRLDHLARRPSEIDVINGQVVALEPRARPRDAVQRDSLRHRPPPRVAVRLTAAEASDRRRDLGTGAMSPAVDRPSPWAPRRSGPPERTSTTAWTIQRSSGDGRPGSSPAGGATAGGAPREGVGAPKGSGRRAVGPGAPRVNERDTVSR